MRERLARIYAVGLGVVIVLLAALFAGRQNTPGAAGPRPAGEAGVPVAAVPPRPVPPEPGVVAQGRRVYEEQGCARCHRVQGDGNPRSPLDGVGARLSPELLRAFVVADDAVRAQLSPSVARAKFAFASLPEGELEALVTYLETLREP